MKRWFSILVTVSFALGFCFQAIAFEISLGSDSGDAPVWVASLSLFGMLLLAPFLWNLWARRRARRPMVCSAVATTSVIISTCLIHARPASRHGDVEHILIVGLGFASNLSITLPALVGLMIDAAATLLRRVGPDPNPGPEGDA